MRLIDHYSFLLLFVLVSLNCVPAQNNKKNPFEIDFTKEAILAGAGTAAGIAALVILSNTQPLGEDELKSLNPFDVNPFDRSAIGTFSDDHLGDAMLWGSYLLPLTFLTNEQARSSFEDLAVMYCEVLLFNAGIAGIVKGLSKRTRPYAYDSSSPLEQTTKTDSRLSFYSGHVSTTASNYFFTASVFNEYLNNNTVKTLIWSAAALIPAVTAFIRVNTHWHFPTDVIVGYIVGAAIGYLVPLIHKTGNDEKELVIPAENFYKPTIGFKINF